MPQLLQRVCHLIPSVTRVAGMATNRATEEFSMAFVTAPNSDKAKEIAGGLVTNKLAACVNIIPGVRNIKTRLDITMVEL